MSAQLPLLTKPAKSYAKKTFLFALLLMAVIFLPFMIQDGGRFILYGDFNVQQIPFYKLAHRAVRSGDIFWNWTTDLGANFFGSYTFYLLFSPFFWMTLPFPNSFIPFLIPLLLILKTACAALAAYCYIERFVKDKFYAMLGGLLYGFSGWMFFNVFFNHFHEVAVFFPLLLLSVEQLVTENRKVFFALMVAVNAMVNYWFFVGTTVFVLLYVIVRCYSGGWGMTWYKFLQMACEAVLGVLLAAVVVLPSVMALMGNPRTDSDRLMSGIGFWIYWHNSSKYGDYAQRLPAILQSIIFPPELTARPNFFDQHGAQWASLSAWLPMASISGVIAYFIQKKNEASWLKKLLALCLFFALIPGLNSLFVALNNSYYARWFYMPILLMALATALAFERLPQEPKTVLTGVKWTFIPALLFAIACGATPQKAGDTWSIGMAKEPGLVWLYFIFVLLGLSIIGVLTAYYNKHRLLKRLLAGGLAVVTMLFGITYFGIGRAIYDRSDKVINTALGLEGKFELPEIGFVRSDIYDDMDNQLMFWGFPNIQTFHSVVPVSIMDFYPTVGVTRDVGSRPEKDYYALRALLSVHWLFIDREKEEQDPMPGFTLWDTQNGYNIYQNDAYIPMGFAYDYRMSESQFRDSTLTKQQKGNLLLRTIILEDDIQSPLPTLPEDYLHNLNAKTFLDDAARRREVSVSDFTIDRFGFSAYSNFAEPQVIFFSVPYEKGWSAAINGESVRILKANIGFMAVEVPAGPAEIRFDYMTPGLYWGLLLSAISALLVIAYWLLSRTRALTPTPHIPAAVQVRNWEEYFAGEAANPEEES